MDKPQLERLLQAAQARNKAKSAELAAVNLKIARIEGDLARLRTTPTLEDPALVGVYGQRQAWSLRKTEALRAELALWQRRRSAMIPAVARAHGQDRAAQKAVDQHDAQGRKSLEKKQEENEIAARSMRRQ